MSPKTRVEMLGGLREWVAAEPARGAAALRCRASAGQIAHRLLLVRRISGGPLPSGSAVRHWTNVVDDLTLVPTPRFPGLESRVGIPNSVYFFLGCGSYPKGDVAILCAASAATDLTSSFWPFDTGAIGKGYLRPRAAGPWTEEHQKACLVEFWGQGAYLFEYVTEYLAGHFDDPANYIRVGQKGSPDYSPYHGLESVDGDRRAWSIEVQIHQPVSLAHGAGLLHRIVLGRPQLLQDLPDELARYAEVTEDIDSGVRSILEGCVQEAA